MLSAGLAALLLLLGLAFRMLRREALVSGNAPADSARPAP